MTTKTLLANAKRPASLCPLMKKVELPVVGFTIKTLLDRVEIYDDEARD